VGKEEREGEGEMVAEWVARAEGLVVGVEPATAPEEGEVEGVANVAEGVTEVDLMGEVEGVPVNPTLTVPRFTLMEGVTERVRVGEVVFEPGCSPTPPPEVRVAPRTPRMVGVSAGVGVSISLPGEGVVMVVGVTAEGEGVE